MGSDSYFCDFSSALDARFLQLTLKTITSIYRCAVQGICYCWYLLFPGSCFECFSLGN